MAKRDFITVKIMDLPGAGATCACMKVSDSPGYAAAIRGKVEELRAALEESYPGKTGVEYVDLRQNLAEKESEVGQLLVTNKYPSPLIVVDGEPRFAGSIQVKKILKEVELKLNP